MFRSRAAGKATNEFYKLRSLFLLYYQTYIRQICLVVELFGFLEEFHFKYEER